MKKTHLFFAILIIATSAYAANSKNAESTPEKNELTGETFPVRFHVEGNRIVDPNGTPVMLRGVVSMDPLVQTWPGNPDEGSWNEGYYREMANWGAKIVRITIHPNTWRNFKTTALETVEQTIEWIGKHHMYAIFDLHGIGFIPTGFFGDLGHGQDQLKITEAEMTEFWVQFASHFADNDIVAFYELFNEPVTSQGEQINTRNDWILWRDMQEGFVDDIRAVDDHTPIICSGLDYTFDLSYVPNDPVRRENIVYAVHIYPFRSQSTFNWYQEFGRVAETYPLFCTEWGFVTDPSHPHASYGLETIYGHAGTFRNEIVDYLEEHNISWTAWCFSPQKSGPNLLEDWNYTPTESGSFVRNTLLEKANQDPTVVFTDSVNSFGVHNIWISDSELNVDILNELYGEVEISIFDTMGCLQYLYKGEKTHSKFQFNELVDNLKNGIFLKPKKPSLNLEVVDPSRALAI